MPTYTEGISLRKTIAIAYTSLLNKNKKVLILASYSSVLKFKYNELNLGLNYGSSNFLANFLRKKKTMKGNNVTYIEVTIESTDEIVSESMLNFRSVKLR